VFKAKIFRRILNDKIPDFEEAVREENAAHGSDFTN